MDEILRRFASWEWSYADRDPQARELLADRIAEVGRRRGLITYSDLVRGVTFRLPNVHSGRPFQIDAFNWTELDRAVIGEFLGHISWESYQQGRILASALVVTKDDGTPGPGFANMVREFGLLRGCDEMAELACWAEEVRKAHLWYGESKR